MSQQAVSVVIIQNSASVPISWLPTQIPVILDAKLAMKKKSCDHAVVSLSGLF